MPYFAWLAGERELSSAALTVRAQTISPNDQGRLLWDVFFPRENHDSFKVSTLTNVDYRPVGDRREFNARGRQIAFITPGTAEFEFIPIETWFRVDEYEINQLMLQTQGNQDLFRRVVGANIPDRVDRLAESDYRRVEVDAMTMWALGQMTVRNPVTGVATTVSLGFDATRYETPAAWTGGTTGTAYANLLSFIDRSIDRMGSIGGIVSRLSSYQAVQQSSPRGTDGIMLTRTQLVDRIQQDIGQEFTFVIREDSYDIYPDGGTDVTRTKVWPANRIAAFPAGNRVGSTFFVPVVRAYEFAPQASEGEIDVRGVSVFNEVGGNGRELSVESQLNACSMAVEQNLSVVNAGI